jgi:Zn-finger nucleic acid-binding protein
MNTCLVCSSKKSQRQKEIEVDYCMVCGIVYLHFGAQRPRLYEQLEKQTQRWQKQSQTLGYQ